MCEIRILLVNNSILISHIHSPLIDLIIYFKIFHSRRFSISDIYVVINMLLDATIGHSISPTRCCSMDIRSKEINWVFRSSTSFLRLDFPDNQLASPLTPFLHFFNRSFTGNFLIRYPFRKSYLI